MPNPYVNKVVKSDGTTLIDLTSDTVTSSDHIMSGYVGHLANGEQVTGTGQSGVNAFIITLSYNSNTSMWEPDCTWAELTAARTAGKDIILTGVYAAGSFSPAGTIYGYVVMEHGDDGDSEYWVSEQGYSFSSSGLTKTDTYQYYDSSDADAAASDVANGKIFYTSSGRGVGSYSGASPTLTTKSITANGTYNASSDNADGYSSVTVNVPHVGPQFDLIGQSTHTLSAYTNTSAWEVIDTNINIKDTNYAYIFAVITCNGTKTNDADWGGLTIAIGSRYTSNRAYYNGSNLWSKNGVSLLFSDMTQGNVSQGSYGVVVQNNTNTIKFQRKAHATACPELMAGTYTVKVYGLTAL